MKQDTDGRGSTSETVAHNLRKLRKEKGLRLEDLEVRLSEIGWPLYASAISNMERARRRVDVNDLTALAAALEVSPAKLLTPPPGGSVTGNTYGAPSEDIEVWVTGGIDSLQPDEALSYWISTKVDVEHQLEAVGADFDSSTSPIIYKMLSEQHARLERELDRIKARLGE